VLLLIQSCPQTLTTAKPGPCTIKKHSITGNGSRSRGDLKVSIVDFFAHEFGLKLPSLAHPLPACKRIPADMPGSRPTTAGSDNCIFPQDQQADKRSLNELFFLLFQSLPISDRPKLTFSNENAPPFAN
jgi:hypothetical protein